MDGCGCIQADSAAGHARHCHGIVSHDDIGDDRPPGARADRLRLRCYPPGTPRDVAATGADREEGLRRSSLLGRGCGSACAPLRQDHHQLSEG